MKEHSLFLNSLTAAPQDVSRPILEELMAEGYDKVTWATSASATDAPCISLDGESWPLSEFLSGLQHDAPVYERAHVGCKCSVSVSGPGKEPVVVSAFGKVD